MQDNQRVGTISFILIALGLVVGFFGFISVNTVWGDTKHLNGIFTAMAIIGAIMFVGGILKLAFFNGKK